MQNEEMCLLLIHRNKILQETDTCKDVQPGPQQGQKKERKIMRKESALSIVYDLSVALQRHAGQEMQNPTI
jgi:hypothetical protein